MSARPPDLGETVGRWRLESLLGEGGMARVFLGVDEHGGQRAIKVMTGELANPELVSRFEQEARLLMRLRHPHLVRVVDAGRVGEAPWMAMEYLSGRPIGALIRASGGLALAIAMPLLAQLADALAALHAAGVVHRDVKPGNVMVNADGWVTLLDLGIARSGEGALTRTGVMYGTPGYMAPEQILGERNIGPPADVYAFGVLVWRMLTGQPPFPAKGDALLVEHLQAKRPELAALRPELPAGLTPVLQLALAVDPALRFPDLGALWEAMELALEGTGHRATLLHALQEVPAPQNPAAASDTLQQLAPVVSQPTVSGRRPVFDDETSPSTPAFSPQEAVETAATSASLRAVDGETARDWARAALVLSIIAAAAVLLVIVAFIAGQPAPPPPATPLATRHQPIASPPTATSAPEADPGLLARREKAAELASATAPVSRSGYSHERVREYAPRSVRRISMGNRGQPQLEIIALVGGVKVRADVDLDGRRVGMTPVIVPIDRRKHSVRVEAAPNPPSRFELTSTGESIRLEVELVPLGAKAFARPATPF